MAYTDMVARRGTLMLITGTEATVMDWVLVVIMVVALLMLAEPSGVLEGKSGKPIHTTAMEEVLLSIPVVLRTLVALSLVIHEVSVRQSPIMDMDLVMVETGSPIMPFPEDLSLQDLDWAITQEVLSVVVNALITLYGVTSTMHSRNNLL